ncbi:MAG: hypothetical protein EOO92_04515 [Pedobacter sp.]|nr:MAG: hypothetical protein EOO92_04515 [Pedobacter sp.]
MRVDYNGIPYYMNHQVWQPGVNDARGIGGDQLQMALSSWRLLYAYNGNERVKENMKFLADYYISHGLSSPTSKWPNIPYPYNTLVYSGIYDGDMVIGKGFTQPDKAGSFGIELIHLYKMLSRERYPHKTNEHYLDVAINIANTLSGKMIAGDSVRSPLPFKVHTETSELGIINQRLKHDSLANQSGYTTNWAGTMEMFVQLIKLKRGNVAAYQKSFDILLKWMKKYPLKNNRWGPFFEDIPEWSDTQINAITFAQFMMSHPEYFPEWKQQVNNIFNWVYLKLGNKTWEKYGVVAVNEQTAYQTPGNSHTSRQASAELEYARITGDTSRVPNAKRQLNWATYMVDNDGKNRYPQDDNWLTDGYGDYVRHYIRSMGSMPELAPSVADHIVYSSSTIQQADYSPVFKKFVQLELSEGDTANARLYYRTFETQGIDVIRMKSRPSVVIVNKVAISENKNGGNYYSWRGLDEGGVLTIHRKDGNTVLIKN